MSVITQTLDNLLNGVSQRAPRLRHPSQAEEQLNGFSDVVRGLRKRPPSEHVAKLSDPVDGSFIHTIHRDADERYRMVISGGDLRVFNQDTGEEYEVRFPRGKAYLNSDRGYRAITVGDHTFVINRGAVVGRGAKTAPKVTPEALIYVRQADFGTFYSVWINDVKVSYTTGLGQAPSSRTEIDTDYIASQIHAKLYQNSDLSGFKFTLHGSTIHVTREDGGDFKIRTADGLADKGLLAIKGKVQLFEDLPLKAPNGFTVQIVGNANSEYDDYWVRFNDKDAAEGAGVWEEIPKPGTSVALDASTMPHVLTYRGAYLGPVRVEALPEIPTIQNDRFVLEETGPKEDGEGNPIGGGNGDDDARLRRHRESAVTDIPGADGQRRRAEFTFDVDASGMEIGEQAQVVVSKLNPITGEWTEIGRRAVEAGRAYERVTIDDEDEYQPGSKVKIELQYTGGSTPQDTSRTGNVRIPGRNSEGGSGVKTWVPRGKRVTWPVGKKYPSGTTITIHLSALPISYTVPAGEDQTSAQVGMALHSLIDANPNYKSEWNAEGNYFIVERTDQTLPQVSVSVEFDDTVRFWSPDMGLTGDDYVGLICRNITDGSEGVITSHTGTTVTVSDLSGGTRNRFSPGDHVEILASGPYFVFREAPWAERSAGGDQEDGFPSFVDKRIQGAFFYQGRLGFLAEDSVVLSAAGDIFRFFRKTATAVLDDDPIDVQSAGQDVASFHTARSWNEGLYIWAASGIYRLDGKPMLTPRTVTLDLVGRYPSDPAVEPLILGDRAFFARRTDRGVQVLEAWVQRTERVGVVEITGEVPTYLQGNPVRLAGDAALGVLLVLTDHEPRNKLYCYKFLDTSEGRVQASWSRWEFPSGGGIVDLDMADGKVALVIHRGDGSYLESLYLGPEEVDEIEEKIRYLDRRCVPTATYTNGVTTWSVPYGYQEGTIVVDRDTGEVFGLTAPGDHRGRRVWAGVPYTFRYEFSPIFFRGRGGQPEPQGRLTVHYVELWYHDTTDVTLSVYPNGRANPYTYRVSTPKPSEGSIRAPVHSTSFRLVLTNDTPGGCALSTLEWEGFYTRRSQRF